MATEEQRRDFRPDIGDEATAFSNDETDRLFERAGESYTDDSLIYLEAKILGVRQLWVAAINRVSYKQGESSESLSDVAKGLRMLLDTLEREQAALIASGHREMQFFHLPGDTGK